MTDAEGHTVWLVGLRPDERTRITGQTTEAIKITFYSRQYGDTTGLPTILTIAFTPRHKTLTLNALLKAAFHSVKGRLLVCNLRHFATPFAVKRKHSVKTRNTGNKATPS